MKIGRKHRIHYRSRPWFPFLILGFGIVFTLAAAYYVDHVADTKDKLLFDRSVAQTRELIDKRFDSYVAILRSASGLFASQQDITLNEFRQYVGLLDLTDRYRGVQGLGYAKLFGAAEKDAIEAYMHNQGVTNFAIKPNNPRDVYHAILYLEPENEQNLAGIGFDMFTTTERRAAMEKARDTALPTATQKIVYPQETDPDKQRGFLIYVPVYSSVTVPPSITARREALRGFVFSNFRTGDLFSSIFGTEQRDVDVYVYDGKTIAPKSLLYSKDYKVPPKDIPERALVATTTINIGGRVWTLYITPTNRFVNSFERTVIPFILAGGFMISFILYLLSRAQYVSRLRAEQLANELLLSKDALEVSEGRIRRIIDANILGVAFTQADGTVTEANDAFLTMTGFSKKDLLQERINMTEMTPSEFHKIDTKIMRELRQKGAHKPYEKEFIKKDGSSLPALVGTAYSKGSRNEIIRLVVDLTERKRLERQKDEFISIASHELKTPVTSLKAYAQVLTKRMVKKGDNDSALHLRKMDAQLDKLTNLIKDLLDVTKIEAGKLQFQNDYFDMNSLVKEIVEEMQRTTDTHQLVINGKITTPLYGDRERIGQVLINFLSNGIKYSPEADRVVISLKQTKDTATVCVEDFGVGIPKEMQTKVFDRFFRVTDPGTQTFPGLGLGLYISSEIIKRQKGKIWVESTKGKGAVFCFSLPRETKK